jgi:predicted phage tail protein
MFKKVLVFVFSGILLLNIYGCVALLAGAAAGAGTKVWLSGKLTQEFNAPYERAINAAEEALRSLKLEVAKVVKEEDVTQIRSQYTDGKEIWIDIRKITDNSTKVEVRVGAVNSDKIAADKILKQIQVHL